MWILDDGLWLDIGIWDDGDFWQDYPAVGVVADLDAFEAGDSAQFIATVPEVITIIGGFGGPQLPKLPPIYGDLKARERGDSCIFVATLGPNPVELDNNLLLLAS